MGAFGGLPPALFPPARVGALRIRSSFAMMAFGLVATGTSKVVTKPADTLACAFGGRGPTSCVSFVTVGRPVMVMVTLRISMLAMRVAVPRSINQKGGKNVPT